MRRKLQMCIADCKRIVHLAVGGDLLDVHWWRNPVKRKVMRVNDTDPFETFEPDPSIQRFGYCRRVAPEGRREVGVPSKPSKAANGMLRLSSLSSATVQPSTSGRAMRTSPHCICNHKEWSSSSTVQCTPSQGKPFLALSVKKRPSFKRLRPPSG